MQRKGKTIIIVTTAIFLFIVSMVLIGISAYRFLEYRTGEAVYEELEDKYTGTDHSKKKENDTDESQLADDDGFSVDWDALLAQNSDVVGWIRTMSGASYPILHGESDDEYIYHDIDHDYNINGSVFLHYANSGKWTDKNSLIYGHNMNSGAMFGTNRKYKDEAFARENPYFWIYTPEGRYTYHIFSIIVTQDLSECYNPDIQTDTEMSEYLKAIRENAMYYFAEPVPEDQVVTLSTCTGQAHGSTRLLIQGYMESFRPADGSPVMTREELQFKMKDMRMQEAADAFDKKHGGNITHEKN